MAKDILFLVEDVGDLPGELSAAGHQVRLLGPDDRTRTTPTGVWESVCSDCIICETSCPVLKFDREHKFMTINQVACKGCGVCVPSCPTGALQQRNLRYGEAAALVAEALGKEVAEINSCNFCLATGGRLTGADAEGATAVRILCSSRFDSGLALESLAGGCQGVLVVGCLRGGGQHAPNDPILARRENELRDLMDLLGLPASRLGVVRAAPGAEGEALTEGVRAFIDGLGDGLYDGPGGEA